MKPKPKRRVVLSFQDFNGGQPTNLIGTYEADSEMDLVKVFDFAVARLREEKFKTKSEKHLHD